MTERPDALMMDDGRVVLTKWPLDEFVQVAAMMATVLSHAPHLLNPERRKQLRGLSILFGAAAGRGGGE